MILSGGVTPKSINVSSKMKELATHLGDELKVFYRDCGSRRTFDINTECQGYHTGGNKKISKKIERYLLKQK